MQKFGLGVVIALTLTVLAYAGILAWHDYYPKLMTQNAAVRSPQDLAQRERMARLVAEVAARSAAQTARTVAQERMRQQTVHAAAENTGGNIAVAANK